jgi:putative sigma-54 modulation protein
MTAKVNVLVRNMELTDRLKEYVSRKAARLDRYLDAIESVQVDLAYVKSARSTADRQVAQMTVRGKGILLRAQERSDDIFASFDAVLDKVERQAERFKGKHWRNRGDGRPASEVAPDEPPEAAEAGLSDRAVVRRKVFPLSPMDENEALQQMELLGHEEFFVFLNAQTNQVNVLYRRRDGGYGLIEPETA